MRLQVLLLLLSLWASCAWGAASRSHYEVLGVGRRASEDDVRRAYRALVREVHPDKGGSPEEFHAVQTAYEVLSDEGKRREYDQELQFGGGQRPGGFAPPGQRAHGPSGHWVRRVVIRNGMMFEERVFVHDMPPQWHGQHYASHSAADGVPNLWLFLILVLFIVLIYRGNAPSGPAGRAGDLAEGAVRSAGAAARTLAGGALSHVSVHDVEQWLRGADSRWSVHKAVVVVTGDGEEEGDEVEDEEDGGSSAATEELVAWMRSRIRIRVLGFVGPLEWRRVDAERDLVGTSVAVAAGMDLLDVAESFAAPPSSEEHGEEGDGERSGRKRVIAILAFRIREGGFDVAPIFIHPSLRRKFDTEEAPGADRTVRDALERLSDGSLPHTTIAFAAAET
jgi:DnaJ domain